MIFIRYCIDVVYIEIMLQGSVRLNAEEVFISLKHHFLVVSSLAELVSGESVTHDDYVGSVSDSRFLQNLYSVFRIVKSVNIAYLLLSP